MASATAPAEMHQVASSQAPSSNVTNANPSHVQARASLTWDTREEAVACAQALFSVPSEEARLVLPS